MWRVNVEASDREEFTYESDVTVMVNTPYTPVSLAIVCDSKIDAIYPSGAVMNLHTGIAEENVGLISFDSPVVTPDSPSVIRVYAAQPFRVLEVKRWIKQ
jgi:hypothetical protein